MIAWEPEKRSTGPLVATIDLLFLTVAFFVLMLYFVQQQRSQAVQNLQTAQEQLEAVSEEKSSIERVMEEVQPFLPKIEALQKADVERRRADEARAARKRQKEGQRMEYQVLPDGTIGYEGKSFGLDQFAREIVEPLREKHWIAFRAFAPPETPFGTVVESRRLLLAGQGEFDTYWDNLPVSKAQP
jgi:hypothetical protein